jgi:hypothetical protein
LLSTHLNSPIRHVFADQGFAGKLVDWALSTGAWRSDQCPNG